MTANTAFSADATDVDAEHTKLLTFELCLVFAVARRDAIALLREGLAQVIEGPGPTDDQWSDVDGAGELLLSQANCEVALSALASPVQRSLRDFVSR